MNLTITRTPNGYLVQASIGLAFGTGPSVRAAGMDWLDDYEVRLADFQAHRASLGPGPAYELAAYEQFTASTRAGDAKFRKIVDAPGSTPRGRLYTLHYNEAGDVVTGSEDFEGDRE